MWCRSILFEMRKHSSDGLPGCNPFGRRGNDRFLLYKYCADHGLDITKGLIPVAPAAHYMMGGVKTNVWGETNIVNLFAAGEVACTGVHGANRLASNSMLEVLVFSKRIIKRTRGEIKESIPRHLNETYRTLRDGEDPAPGVLPSLRALQDLLWNQVGIIRDKAGLTKAAGTLSTWQKCLPEATDRPTYELNNLVLTGRLVAEAALIREESRGAHFRADFPQHSVEWENTRI
jgi:L-aspartate oxidase